jgi:hypothetical protein
LMEPIALFVHVCIGKQAGIDCFCHPEGAQH